MDLNFGFYVLIGSENFNFIKFDIALNREVA